MKKLLNSDPRVTEEMVQSYNILRKICHVIFQIQLKFLTQRTYENFFRYVMMSNNMLVVMI